METLNWPSILEDIKKAILRHPEFLPSLDAPSRNAVKKVLDGLLKIQFNHKRLGREKPEFSSDSVASAMLSVRPVSHERIVFVHASLKGGHNDITSGTECLMREEICKTCIMVIRIGAFAYKGEIENGRIFSCVLCEQKRKTRLARLNKKIARERR